MKDYTYIQEHFLYESRPEYFENLYKNDVNVFGIEDLSLSKQVFSIMAMTDMYLLIDEELKKYIFPMNKYSYINAVNFYIDLYLKESPNRFSDFLREEFLKNIHNYIANYESVSFEKHEDMVAFFNKINCMMVYQKRNKLFNENIMKIMNNTKHNTVVFTVGAGHVHPQDLLEPDCLEYSGPGIKEYLKNNNISYIEITPLVEGWTK